MRQETVKRLESLEKEKEKLVRDILIKATKKQN